MCATVLNYVRSATCSCQSMGEMGTHTQWHYLKALELVAWVEERRDETHGVDAMGPIDGLRTA